MIGVEIEGIFNSDVVPLTTHNCSVTPNWYSKYDGSLRDMDEFEEGLARELVSKPVERYSTFLKQLKEFQKFVAPDGQELKDVVVFNSSCGCHIHFSIKKKLIGHKMCVELIRDFRRDFFKGLKELPIKEEAKILILKHYLRKFSRRTTKSNFYRGRRYSHRGRNFEFNRNSEDGGKGMEWRGFNLLGIDNWEDFFTIFDYVYICLNKLTSKLKKGYSSKKNVIKLNGIEKDSMCLVDNVENEEMSFSLDCDDEMLEIEKEEDKDETSLLYLKKKEDEEWSIHIEKELEERGFTIPSEETICLI